jgi:predicted transcriptional regulator
MGHRRLSRGYRQACSAGIQHDPFRIGDSVPDRSKGAKILELIGRSKGASLAEIVKATDWQKHSIRGFLSTAAKKHGLKIESTKTEDGDRVYQAKK